MSKKAGTFDTFFDVGRDQLIAFLEPNGVPDVPAKYDAGVNRGLGVPAVICLRGRFGGCAGREAKEFLTSTPPDFELTSLSQTFGRDRIVEEFVIRFTHTLKMNWMLPGLLATGRKVELGLVGIIQFQAGKVANERLYWDQATVLSQLRVLDHPVAAAGVGSAAQLLQLR